MEKRAELKLENSIVEVLTVLGEGNPGALSILTKLFQKSEDDPEVFGAILALDDMNMRGSQIWVAFKDFAGESMDDFIESCLTRNDKMIEVVNEQTPVGDFLAVKAGASMGKRPRK